MNTSFYTYAHRRLSTGAIFYVGKGRGDRAFSHSRRNNHWTNIVSRDGGRVVEFLVKNVDEEFAFFVEQEAIALFKHRGMSLVNYTNGGEGCSGYKHSDSAKAKVSASRKGCTPWTKGKSHTAATLKKMSDSHKGKPGWGKGLSRSEETIKKISDARRGKISKNKGVPLTTALKEKLSAASKGRPNWSKGMKKGSSKPVMCITTGQVFQSALSAALYYGASDKSAVSACCRGATKTAYRMVFKYL